MPLHLAVLMGSVGPNTDPHACKASTVLTKPCLALKTLLALFWTSSLLSYGTRLSLSPSSSQESKVNGSQAGFPGVWDALLPAPASYPLSSRPYWMRLLS